MTTNRRAAVYAPERFPHRTRPTIPGHQAWRRQELLQYLSSHCDAVGKLIWSPAHIRALTARGLSQFEVGIELEALAGNGLLACRRAGALTILMVPPAAGGRGR